MDDKFSNADAYEAYVGRWSRLVAHEFLEWLDVAPGGTWLDVGVGTGILAEAILQNATPAKVVGVDSSQEYIGFARHRIYDDRAEFRVGDAANMVTGAPQFDAAVAGLVLNFLPAPQQAVESMTRAVNSGGTVAAYVWDYGGQMEMMRHFWDAASQIDPAAKEMDSGQRFAICKPERLRASFQAVDLRAIEVIPIDVPTLFRDFDNYWLPFLGAQGSVSKYLHGLNDKMLTLTRDQLQRQLPTMEDGSIPLIARAWAVKGKKTSPVR